MSDSILDTIKKLLGIDPAYDVFDVDIVTHINSVFLPLQQLGVGPDEGFMITDNTSKWQDFLGEDKNLNAVKTLMGLRVRLLFDPPATSFAIAAMEKVAMEYEWRLNVHADKEATI